MKKVIIVFLLIISFLMLDTDDSKIMKDTIRFRIIANSNASNDIIMKEKVVSELSNTLFKSSTKEETRDNIIKNVSTIENKIDKIFDANNYKETYNIVYGLNEFPEKEYNGKKYPAGLYESLVIEIGEAKGDNYWCFLYPSLCMIDYNSKEKTEYKLKIVDLFNKLF